MSATTLFDKIWAAHEVAPGLVYIDLHLVHEVTSPQAFDGLRLNEPHRPPPRPHARDRRPQRAHRRHPGRRADPPTSSRACRWRRSSATATEFGIPVYSLGSDRRGIVHIIGPELGVTQPGMTIVCGDSHTATHGAFGALAFGIGTSEVEHVLATQTLASRSRRACGSATRAASATASPPKDLILGTIGQMGTGGAAGHVVEYAGPAIEALSMEGRMTVCNMTIEGGGRAGMIAPDDTTFAWLEGRPAAPADLDAAVEEWRGLRTDDGAAFDREIVVDASALSPLVTWGTTPAQVVGVGDAVPEPRTETDERALRYMALEPGTPMQDIRLDRVFIGSCTNARIGDLRAAARVVEGRKVAPTSRRWSSPAPSRCARRPRPRASTACSRPPASTGGRAGCSMCLGMNPDILAPGERCASTSNRNFEGRQGRGGRTHLVSPEMAAAAAIEGRFVDIRSWSWMEPVRRSISGKVSVLDRADVDTDQIIPKQFLKRVERTGFGEFLFHDWAKEPGWDLPAEPDPRRRPELRLRLEPRARPLGARGLRLPRDRRRRASPTSSSPTARRSACCRSSCRRTRSAR